MAMMMPPDPQALGGAAGIDGDPMQAMLATAMQGPRKRKKGRKRKKARRGRR